MSYQYGGSEFNTLRQRNLAKISSYLYADGLNDNDVVYACFEDTTAEYLAEDMLKYMPDEFMDLETATTLMQEFKETFLATYSEGNML